MSSRVVIVEDDEAIRRLHSTVLRAHGYEVIEREDADDLNALVCAAEPVAVLMDLSLPGTSGVTATERLRTDPRVAGTRVVMVTAHDTFEAARLATDAGVDRILIKPVPAADLVAAVVGLKRVARPHK